VIAVERAAVLTLGMLRFELRIDRIDSLPDDHGAVIVDYKTGTADPTALFGRRPREPQLAMYALCVPDVMGVLFAHVAHDDCRVGGWRSETATELSLPVPPADIAASWQRLVELWRADLTQLATEFALGVAEVAPRDADACRECNLQPLCRIHAVRQFAND
jgi:ATP-dependent helicase/nuclease subunit B